MSILAPCSGLHSPGCSGSWGSAGLLWEACGGPGQSAQRLASMRNAEPHGSFERAELPAGSQPEGDLERSVSTWPRHAGLWPDFTLTPTLMVSSPPSRDSTLVMDAKPGVGGIPVIPATQGLEAGRSRAQRWPGQS
jgi:hypothetical protein